MHAEFGLGRISDCIDRRYAVQFFRNNQRLNFASLDPLQRWPIPIGTKCECDEGICEVTDRILDNGKWSSLNKYDVKFPDGRLAQSWESQLRPDTAAAKATSPVDGLSRLIIEPLAAFRTREFFIEAHFAALRAGLGIRALIGSRIDLMPHQAYVAGVVMLDHRRRYILADEVGLGKTIEAGIIIHDLLATNPDARVLVICPGSLSQQWLAELYSKFARHVFSMPELSSAPETPISSLSKIILSYSGALANGSELKANAWDIVVVDEAHHLLDSEPLYDLVTDISRACGSILLLSALPAQHRVDEYCQLLTLLDPSVNKFTTPAAKKRFGELYARQQRIGLVLDWVARHIEDVESGEMEPPHLLGKLNELTEMPVLKDDKQLRRMLGTIKKLGPGFRSDVHAIMHHIGDAYRINRRILKNRRSRLVRSGEIVETRRALEIIPYEASQFEFDARKRVHDLIFSLRDKNVADDVLHPLSRHLLQASITPESLLRVLRFGEEIAKSADESGEFSAIVLPDTAGYSNWAENLKALWSLVVSKLGRGSLRSAIAAADLWLTEGNGSKRGARLVSYLTDLHRDNPETKVLIFAGFPSQAADLRQLLTLNFGQVSVASFIADMKDSRKDDEVRRVKKDRHCWVLVSDESGGEGRNFQFFDKLVHFDLPWSSSKIEQRIGRLDRIGRVNPDVTSGVLVSTDTEDEAYLNILDQGLGIFRRSISGLEFAIRDVESNIMASYIKDATEGLLPLIGQIAETADRERAEDENLELLDEASFERNAAMEFRGAISNPAREKSLEQSFIKYLKHVAGGKAVVPGKDPEFADGVFQLFPDDMPKNGGTGELARTGTFQRPIAQERPHIDFFAPSHPFYDELVYHVERQMIGRTYAIECVGSGEAWSGFETMWKIRPPQIEAELSKDFRNAVGRIFPPRIEHVFVSETGSITESNDRLLSIRRSLRSDHENIDWFNLQKTGSDALVAHFRDKGWTKMIKVAVASGKEEAMKHFKQLLDPGIESEIQRSKVRIDELKRLKPAGWVDEAALLKDYIKELKCWDLDIDSLGFFAVNTNISGKFN